MGEAEVKITQSFDHRRLNSSIHQVHHDERLRQSIITGNSLSVKLIRNIIIFFFSDYKKVKMMKMMMILRRRLRGTGRKGKERDKGTVLCWICHSNLNPTSLKVLQFEEVIQTLVNLSLILDQRRTWTIMILAGILMRRMTKLTEMTKLQLPTTCSRWWIRSGQWLRWQWRKPRRIRIFQAKNVSISNNIWEQTFPWCVPVLWIVWTVVIRLEWRFDLNITLDPSLREGNSWARKCSLNHINIR